MNLPNAITLARLVSVPAIVWLILGAHWRSAFTLFVLAGLSDAVDGYLARRWQQQTALGAWLDPLADKALLVAVYVVLAAGGLLAPWVAVLVLGCDLLIVAGIGVARLSAVPLEIRPSRLGKVTTVVQIVLAAAALAGVAFPLAPLHTLLDPLVWLVAATTLASVMVYAVQWQRQMRFMREPR